MTRKEFMEQLAVLLAGISESERQEALDYYNNYFDDAGPENEAAVIQELGISGKVAAIIKEDLEQGSDEFAQYTERGYEDSRMHREEQMPQTFENGRTGYRARRKNSQSNRILLVILVICAVPILLGIGGGVLGGILGLAGGIVGLVIGLLTGALVCVIGGFALAVAGILKCFTGPAVGLALMGGGFLMIAIGWLLGVAFIWLVCGFAPWLIRKLAGFCQKHFRSPGKGAQKV